MIRLHRWLPVAAGVLVVSVLGYVAWAFVAAPDAAPMAYVEAPVAAPAAPVADAEPAPAAPAGAGAGVKDPDPAWVAKTAAAAGIPVPAMRAYARAQLARPAGCAIGWTTLAGVGWIESQHGTLGGRTVADDGRSSTPIVGPALGALDHAYGPMQFIPSTWSRWASDGDGDGLADIDDLDDAAMTAMRYLCGAGYDLATGQGWSQAIFAYNHSQQYVDDVYAAAQSYAQRTR
ncbi:MAG: lytic murein transglycosylase [Nocardioides sp.]